MVLQWWTCGGPGQNRLVKQKRKVSVVVVIIAWWWWFTICGDACPLSCVNAEACLTGWPNA